MAMYANWRTNRYRIRRWVNDMELAVFLQIAIPLLCIFLGAYLSNWFVQPSLIAYIGFVADFHIKTDTNPVDIFTHSLVIRNQGKKVANNVRLGHFCLPPNYRVSPSVDYSIETTSNGIKEILLPRLLPGEQITISYVYFDSIVTGKIHNYVKSDEVLARVVKVLSVQQYPTWVNNCIRVFIFLGFCTAIYMAWRLFSLVL